VKRLVAAFVLALVFVVVLSGCGPKSSCTVGDWKVSECGLNNCSGGTIDPQGYQHCGGVASPYGP
jgi:hypothetical protein